MLKNRSNSNHNAKRINVLDEEDDGGGDEYSRFGIPVNISYSSVHVPSNVLEDTRVNIDNSYELTENKKCSSSTYVVNSEGIGLIRHTTYLPCQY